jgi:hypothetical protein
MKPYVRVNFLTGGLDLWLVDERPFPDGKVRVARPVALEWVAVEQGFSSPPTLTVHDGSFGSALAQALRDERVAPPAASFVEGELAGTKKHLEDLRALLGLGKA